jgi:DNA-binding response OmpR family regulator/EAL domain-containing protein (putative c-di-GMP-specific phosphodiesterase class I)
VDLLGGGDTMAGHLQAALAAEAGQLRRFDRAEQWVETVRQSVPDAVMVPASLSSAITELLGKLNLAGAATGNVLLAAFGRPKERLDALIGGADWFVERSTDPLLGRALVDWLLQQDTDPFRVLLVDDDRETRLLCSAVLRKVGMKVEEEPEAGRVLEAVRRFRPDLVLLDLHMPDRDGISVVQSLRASDIAPLLPVVFLSGEDRPSARNAALLVGADDFIAKPVRPQALVAAVRSRIKRARSLNRQLRPLAGAERGRLRRSHFLDLLEARLQRPAGEWQLLLALRIDQAAELRESLGLAATHALERQVGERLSQLLGAQDGYTLWEELGFGLLLCHGEQEQLQRLIGDLLLAIAGEPFDIEGRSHTLRASIGFSLPPSGERAGREAWLRQAFAALAMARRLGGARAEGVLSRDPSTLPPERIMVITQALKDLARGSSPRFEFQPMLQLRGEQGHYTLISTLPDLRHPLEGYPRQQYLGLARELDQLALIDRMSLFHAIETLDDRRQRGLSARVLVEVDLDAFDPRQIAWLSAERQRRPEAVGDLLLEIDIAALRSGRHAEVLRQLGALGLTLAAADSSGSVLGLQELQTASVGLLRLPHSAILQAAGPQLSELIDQWRSAGRRLLVDQVDSMRAVSGLWNLGIDYLQGNALAAPLPRIEDDEA